MVCTSSWVVSKLVSCSTDRDRPLRCVEILGMRLMIDRLETNVRGKKVRDDGPAGVHIKKSTRFRKKKT